MTLDDHWISVSSRKPPAGIKVLTKIEDYRGTRNVQEMIYERNLWWLKDRSMYVYYEPTHWKNLP